MPEEQKVTLTGAQLAQLANQENQKLGEVNRRLTAFQGFRNELAAAKEALDEIAKTEKGEKMLVNLGAGIFCQATLEDPAKAVATIAPSAYKEKSTKELSKTLEKKIGELNKTIEGIIGEQQKTASRLNQLEQVMNAGMQYARQQRQNQQ